MTQESDQSVKEVLEDIRKVISGSDGGKHPAETDVLSEEKEDGSFVEHHGEEPLDLTDEVLPDVLESIDKALDVGQSDVLMSEQDKIELSQPWSDAKEPKVIDEGTNMDHSQKAVELPAQEDVEKEVLSFPVNSTSLSEQGLATERFIKNQEKPSLSDGTLTSQESSLSTAMEIKHLIDRIHESRKHFGLPIENSVTVEEMVMSMIKPELSRWLNNNLPRLVREVVEKEIRQIIDKSS